MRVAILYHRLFDPGRNQPLIGGIQSYLIALAQLCVARGWVPRLYQYSAEDFETRISGIPLLGVGTDARSVGERIRRVYQRALADIHADRDLVIFGADHCSLRTDRHRAMLIQHGVSWDLPTSEARPDLGWREPFIGGLVRQRQRRLAVHQFENCRFRVCVDYNYLNWYRTQVDTPAPGRVWVIPNACDIPPAPPPRPQGTVSILFARRFFIYRGTRLMESAARRLLHECPQVRFTFAGDGPDEEWLRAAFAGEARVAFSRYTPDELSSVLARHDIAVVPSIGSEGTSLAVAEAMASACAVVASGVGGIPGMIIDGYNGRLVQPNSGELLSALRELVLDTRLREVLAQRARATALAAFSRERWADQWHDAIAAVMADRATALAPGAAGT
jgi:glycosyltransferase involved in cell wall biosynthesis